MGNARAAIYSLIVSAKLNEIDREAHLRYVPDRSADHPYQSHR